MSEETTMKTYKAIQAEIAKLEEQAEEVREKEVAAVVAQIKQAIAEYGITPADLGLGPARQVRKAAHRNAVGVPKYRDPKSGRTWTGRGRPPAWIANAKNRDNFLI